MSGLPRATRQSKRLAGVTKSYAPPKYDIFEDSDQEDIIPDTTVGDATGTKRSRRPLQSLDGNAVLLDQISSKKLKFQPSEPQATQTLDLTATHNVSQAHTVDTNTQSLHCSHAEESNPDDSEYISDLDDEEYGELEDDEEYEEIEDEEDLARLDCDAILYGIDLGISDDGQFEQGPVHQKILSTLHTAYNDLESNLNITSSQTEDLESDQETWQRLRHRLKRILKKLFDHALTTRPSDGTTWSKSGWHTIMWAFCHRLATNNKLEHAVDKLMRAFLPVSIHELGKEQVHIERLFQCLEDVASDTTGNITYAILSDPSIQDARYVGKTNCGVRRTQEHRDSIRASSQYWEDHPDASIEDLREHLKSASIQYCHAILGRPGMDVSYKVISTFDPTVTFYMYQHLNELVMIQFFQSLRRTSVQTTYSKHATFDFLSTNIEFSVICHDTEEHTRLNLSSPMGSPCPGSDRRPKKCENCSDTECLHWFTFGDELFEKYICVNCYGFQKKHGKDRPTDMHMKLMARRSLLAISDAELLCGKCHISKTEKPEHVTWSIYDGSWFCAECFPNKHAFYRSGLHGRSCYACHVTRSSQFRKLTLSGSTYHFCTVCCTTIIDPQRGEGVPDDVILQNVVEYGKTRQHKPSGQRGDKKLRNTCALPACGSTDGAPYAERSLPDDTTIILCRHCASLLSYNNARTLSDGLTKEAVIEMLTKGATRRNLDKDIQKQSQRFCEVQDCRKLVLANQLDRTGQVVGRRFWDGTVIRMCDDCTKAFHCIRHTRGSTLGDWKDLTTIQILEMLNDEARARNVPGCEVPDCQTVFESTERLLQQSKKIGLTESETVRVCIACGRAWQAIKCHLASIEQGPGEKPDNVAYKEYSALELLEMLSEKVRKRISLDEMQGCGVPACDTLFDPTQDLSGQYMKVGLSGEEVFKFCLVCHLAWIKIKARLTRQDRERRRTAYKDYTTLELLEMLTNDVRERETSAG